MKAMRMRTALIGIVLLGGFLLTGCGAAIKKQVPSANWTHSATPQLSRADYAVLDRVEGQSTTHSVLLGLIDIIDGKVKIFGIRFFEDKYAYEPISKFLPFELFQDRTKDRALFKTLAKSPDADAILRRTITVEKSGIPAIFTTTTVRCSGKAIKIKTDEELYEE
ncbi:MAG: hypothetical protein KGY61_11980 [Desulfobacterales bacterium]|nr:hypothetical protein [Desulfobacterales bacterium]